MIISCFTNSYGRFGARAALEHLPQVGITHIELPIRTAGVPSLFGDEPLLTEQSSSEEIQQVRDLLEEHGMALSSCNITSGNPLQRDVTDITRRKLDLAAQLGVSLVVGGAGEAADEAERKQLLQHLREIGDHAGARGITYCFETHPGLCVNHRAMRETMEELNHPHLKLNFDTGNISYYNHNINVEIALAKVCPHVRHVHLKDHSGVPREWYFPALGCGGAVDFLRVYEILRDAGFRGPFSIEIEGIAGEGELSLADYQQRIAESVRTLRDCGYFDPL